MKFIRITYKSIYLVSLAVTAVGVMFFYSLGADKSSPNAKQKAYRKKWLGKVVKVIGLEVQVNGRETDAFEVAAGFDNLAKGSKQKPALWVANHISWMDIAVVGSQGAGFLSKSEVRKWPLIGWLGDKGGTVFIERGGKNASQEAAKAIAEKISAGDNILVFPEGTTSLGENVKHFHARIFAPALDHQLLVQPIVIQYLDEQGQLHPNAVWDNQYFISNLLGVLAQPSIRVILTFLPIVDAQQFSGRRQLAELVENQIRDVVIATSAIKIA